MLQPIIQSESDITFEQSITEIDIDYDRSSIFKKAHDDLDENDYDVIRNCLLFKNWAHNTLENFIEDNRIVLKRYKYKDVIAREEDYHNNIYILKSGIARCYIKVGRSQIKNHQKILESDSTTPYFIEPNIEKQKNKNLRDNLLSSQSNHHALKSKYLDYRRERTFHALSLKSDKQKINNTKVTFNSYESDTASKSILKTKPTIDLNLYDSKPLNSTYLVKPMSALVDTKYTHNPNMFRSSSTNMVRMNRTIKFLVNKHTQSDNLTHPIEVVSNHNMSEPLDLNSSQTQKQTNTYEELEACQKIKTRNPEVWGEIYNFNQTGCCFLRLMDIKPGQIFGLSETLFDEKSKRDKLNLSNSTYYEDESENKDPESNASNKYNLITDSKYAECYIIDKETYLKFMLTFTTDKTIINKYLDEMKENCIQLPSVRAVNEKFFHHLTWKLYKKRAYNELVDLNLRKKL